VIAADPRGARRRDRKNAIDGAACQRGCGSAGGLIADPRHLVLSIITIRLTEETGQGDSRNPAAAFDGARHCRDRRRGPELGIAIADYLDILRSRPRVLAIVKDELAVVRKEFATRARPNCQAEIESRTKLIEREDVAVTVTHAATSSARPWRYALQPGRKGRAGMATREEISSPFFVANTPRAAAVLFLSIGMVSA